MKRDDRLRALESKTPQTYFIHCPRDKDDHAAKWASFMERGLIPRLVRFARINDDAVAAFLAAKPAA